MARQCPCDRTRSLDIPVSPQSTLFRANGNVSGSLRLGTSIITTNHSRKAVADLSENDLAAVTTLLVEWFALIAVSPRPRAHIRLKLEARTI